MKVKLIILALVLFASTLQGADKTIWQLIETTSTNAKEDSLFFEIAVKHGSTKYSRKILWKNLVASMKDTLVDLPTWLTGANIAQATITPSKMKDYLFKYTSVTDVLTEQTYTTTTTTAFGIDSLDSGQSALPTFTGTVDVQIAAKYQERGGAITTKPTVSGGKVTWGFTLDPWGNNRSDGTVHFDFVIKQL
jgi:hypothetical protein